MNVFRQNYDLLLRIFNPEGWLEITYPFEMSFLYRIYLLDIVNSELKEAFVP